MRRSTAPVAGFWRSEDGRLLSLPSAIDRTLLLVLRGRRLRHLLGRAYARDAYAVAATPACAAEPVVTGGAEHVA